MTRRSDWNLRKEFERRAYPEAISGCWLWHGGISSSGYGVLGTGRRGQTIRAHRYAYETFVGPLVEGLDVCHKCDVRACVNPDHLYLGTRKENMQDAVRRGRICAGERRARVSARGERHGNTRLTELDVRCIRNLRHIWGEKLEHIAWAFGISVTSVSAIINRRVWTHVGDVLLPEDCVWEGEVAA